MNVGHGISAKIKNMGFVCACLVVSIHIGLSGEKFTGPWMLKEFIAEGIARIAVPFFFVASGYFIAMKYMVSLNKMRTWKDEVCKRINTLAVPYWIWNLLYAPLFLGLALFSDIAAGRAVRHIDWLSIVLRCSGLDIMNSPLLYPLWFIRNLLILIVASPVIFQIISKVPRVTISIVSIIYICFEIWGIKLPSLVSLQGLAYFSFGMALGSGMRIAPILRSRPIGIVLCIVSIIALGWSKIGELPITTVTFIIPLLLAGLWCFIPNCPWNNRFTSFTFPIYLIHPFVLLLLQYLWHITAYLPTTLEFLFRWSIAIGMSILIAHLIKKKFPRFATLAFGGRI